MKYPAIFSIMKTTSRNNISLHLHEELQPSFDSRQCTGIGQHLKLRLKESDERGQLHFLLSAHFNYASQRERQIHCLRYSPPLLPIYAY